jgi:hypothetical protein
MLVGCGEDVGPPPIILSTDAAKAGPVVGPPPMTLFTCAFEVPEPPSSMTSRIVRMLIG